MTIIKVLKWAVTEFDKAKIPSALLDAEVLLMHVIKKSKEFILINPDQKITKSQENKFISLVKKRKKFEPVAYLTGTKEFYDFNFIVNKHVLIPRPETELLVEEVIKYVGHKKITVVDIGTGSGAIAISLKKNLPNINLIATDISQSALKIAQKNSELNGVKINFIKTNLISGINQKIDIMVANLPYIPEAEKKLKNIYTAPLKYEPAQALYAGKYGLDAYEELFKQINKLTSKPTAIFCEIGSTYINKTQALTKKYFPNSTVEIKKDLCGKNRLLIIKN